MDVNLMNPFIESFTENLSKLGFKSVERTNLTVIGSTLKLSGIIINISLIGQYKGASIIGMDNDTAKKFASKMMMGMELAELNDLAQSAISEMGNMVCADACLKFSAVGIRGLDISPPTLLIVANGVVKLPVPKAISISYLADGLPINMYIGISEE